MHPVLRPSVTRVGVAAGSCGGGNPRLDAATLRVQPFTASTVTFSELITGFGLDDVILSSGWASNILDVTPDEFRPAWNLLFDSCTTADNANEVARRIGVAYPLPYVHTRD